MKNKIIYLLRLGDYCFVYNHQKQIAAKLPLRLDRDYAIDNTQLSIAIEQIDSKKFDVSFKYGKLLLVNGNQTIDIDAIPCKDEISLFTEEQKKKRFTSKAYAIDNMVYANKLLSVSKCCSKDISRLEFCGVCIDKTSICATDGQTLNTTTLDYPQLNDCLMMIVHRECFEKLDNTDRITVWLSHDDYSVVEACHGEYSMFYMRHIIPGMFPDFRNVVPKPRYSFNFDSSKMLRGLKAFNVAKNKVGLTKFEYSREDKRAKISLMNNSTIILTTGIPCYLRSDSEQVEQFTIGFNNKLLARAIESIEMIHGKGIDLRMDIKDADSPIVLRAEKAIENRDEFFIVMPMSLD